LQQVILNLTEKVEQPWCLTGEAYNEEKILPLQIAANDRIGLHFVYANKLILCYLFGQYSEAVVNAEQVQMYLDGVRGTLYIPIYYFYDCLARLAIYLSVERNQQQQILAHVEQYQDTMQMWAEYAPMNFEHKYDLVAAEKYRVLGENYQAMEYYDQAIAKAAKNDYIQEEALANELAAKFYLNWNKSKIAKTYMTEAYYCYIKWGATTKAQDLERRYPELIIRSDTTNFHNIVVTSTTHSTGSTSSSSQILDLSTIIKASEAISSKVFLDNLPRQILHIILENAGAKHGCLILNKNNQLFVEAIDNDSNAIVVPESILVQHSSHVPISLINYVARTQQTIVIKDGTTDFLTKNDHYIIQHQCKSILCIPLINQGKFEGIIYLENNLTSNAFTLRRLELIKILASQATIAINNANLYAKEQEKSQQLQATVQQLEQALTKLQQTQTQLVHTEKISSLGQLVAGIAHEVNNPVSFINGSLAHANQYVQDLLHILKLYRSQFPQPGAEIEEVIETIDLEYILADLPKIISSMKLGTTRIKDIMQSLRNFSRNDGDDMRRANIHEGIDSTLLILGHRLKNNPSRPEIQVTKEYGNLPLVKCYPGALNQVFMNILANAIDALEEFNQGKTYQEIEENPNKIIISTTTEDNWAIIRIKDNGSGISKEKREKLFQAFFTTKPEGKGTGLGLSISYQILTEKHGGILECVSAIGEGSEFIIKLPCDR
jgi:signal transduction histidine kinase